MPRWLILGAGAAVLALAVWLWGLGGMADVSRWASAAQREAQDGMARALRALRAGEAGALAALWSVCFAYGFFHAAGPGHGKVVIGGYGLGQRVPLGRLTGLALGSSLAQAGTAVLLVYTGVVLLGWGRTDAQALADGTLAAISYAMIGALGLWLAFRGVRGLIRLRAAGRGHHDHDRHHHHDHAHPHGEGEVCATCGRAHGPTIAQVQDAKGWRDALAIIAAIAVRPCTGAIFLLILTWRMGLVWQGIIGAVIMALGTATITVAVAVGSVALRESAWMQLASGPGVPRLAALLEILVGGVVVLVSWQLLMRVI